MQHARTLSSAVAGFAIVVALVTGAAVSANAHHHSSVGANGYDTSPGAVQGPSDGPTPTPSAS